MSKIIPVMVHHETGEKAQAAGKKNQEYLKYCISDGNAFGGINRNILECKEIYRTEQRRRTKVLIETYWNVKG